MKKWFESLFKGSNIPNPATPEPEHAVTHALTMSNELGLVPFERVKIKGAFGEGEFDHFNPEKGYGIRLDGFVGVCYFSANQLERE